jgi:hypothetical protein
MYLGGLAAALLGALVVSFVPVTRLVDGPRPPGVGTTRAATPQTQLPSPPASTDPARRPEGVRVTVKVADANHRPLSTAVVVMTADAGPGRRETSADAVEILPDGSFVFANVLPGAYLIQARAGTVAGQAPLVALHRIVVQRRDVTVTLTLLPGASVSGRLVADVGSAPRVTFAGLRIQASSADGSGFGDAVAADVLKDGVFTIQGITSGHHVLIVEGLVDPWVLESVTHRGQDVTDAGVEVSTGRSIDDVRVAITSEATEVSGTVRDPDGRVASGALVLLIPPAPEFWTRVSRRFGRTVTDAEGRYRVRGLPPGDYRVAACMLDAREAYRPELLRQLSAAGVRLSLDSRAREVIELRLTPATIMSRPSVR